MNFLVLRSGARQWCVPMRDVAEVLGEPIVTSLPLLPSPVRGVLTLRGRALPAIDLGLFDGSPSNATLAVVLTDGTWRAALLADAVDEVREDEPGNEIRSFDLQIWMQNAT
jgi:purine-binding chemotaxis protein CheW